MTNTIKLLAVASRFPLPPPLRRTRACASRSPRPSRPSRPRLPTSRHRRLAADVQNPALKLPADLTPADKAQTADEPQPQDGKQAPQPEKAAQPDKAGKAK